MNNTLKMGLVATLAFGLGIALPISATTDAERDKLVQAQSKLVEAQALINEVLNPTTTTTVAPTTTTEASTTTVASTTTTTVAPAGSWPGPLNTGPDNGPLTVMPSRTVRDGEVLENFDITGTVKFEGNATIRNGIIRGGLYGLSHTRSTVPGTTVIENVKLIGQGGSAGIAPYGSWILRNADISGYVDSIKVGSDQVVEYSWLHDHWKADGTHNDGIQSTGGSNVVIRGNNIEGPFKASTSALILGNMTNYTIEGNRLSGGSYTVYIGGKDGGVVPKNIILRNNVWVYGSWLYGSKSFRLGWPGTDSGAVISGNVYDTGGSVF